MIILRATNDSGVTVELDVNDSNQPLRLDISAIENGSIGEVFGISSQTFSLPGTQKNNAFFGNLFNLGSTPSVALQDSIPCQLLTDGAEVFKGRLYITDIITDQKGYTTYQVNVVNESVDFKFQLTDTYLTELDWSKYNHAYTYGNITSSWDFTLANGDIVYPNVDYGRAEGDPDAPTYEFTNNFSSTTFDNSCKPLRVQDFKPAIRAKAVLDTIFESVGYQYTSSFISSSYFQNLYLLTTPDDGIGVANANPSSGSFYAYRETSNQVFNALTDTKINFNAELYDAFNRYDLVNDEYTTYAQGQYGFTLAFTYSISNYSIDNRLRFFVTLQDDTGAQLAGRTFVDPAQTGQLIAPFPLITLPANKKVRAFVELFTDDGSEVVTIGFGQNATFFELYQGPKSIVNNIVNMGEQFADDFLALDFLQGLIEKFNLVIEPVPNTERLLRIEPFQDWIDQGVNKDWTDRVDRSQRFTITHPINEQPKVIEFRDEEDDDALNQYTLDRFNEVYGTYIFTNESDLATGKREVGKVFAATPVKNIPNSTDFIIPMLYKRESGQEPRPFKFKPRLLYANGKKTVPQEAFGGICGQTRLPVVSQKGRYWFVDENSVIHPQTSWFQMTSYETLPASNTTRDLHFGNRKNPGWWPYFQPNVKGSTENSAYHLYWETYINSLYDIDARKLTCNVYLKPTDIQEIALNDLYFIDGAYYRINKINGANLSYRDSVEVELIKTLDRKLVYPRRRVIDRTLDIPVDLQVRGEDANGQVVYQDYDTGLVVNDFDLINQVAAKDGYRVFDFNGTGSAVWDTLSPVSVPLSVNVSPGNNVDPIAARVNVVGTNNTLEQNVTDSTVSGTSNTIRAFTDTTLVTGFDNIVDVDQSNVAIIASLTSSIENGTDNSLVLGGSGSLINNGDWVAIINGTKDQVRDSDNTTAITSGENEVIINGSGHTVLTLNREGAGLDLLEKRNKSNYLGDTYIGGGLLIDSYTINVGDSTNYFLTGSAMGGGKHETVYLLNWNGLSPGTASIHLPNASNNDYKGAQYTFKANGTFDGTTNLEIVPFDPAQTIDGSATYTLRSAYDTVTIFNTGSLWYVTNTAARSGGAFGNFFSTASQDLISVGVSQSVKLDNTYAADGIYISGSSRIYFEKAGTYQFSYVAQVENDSNAQEDANFWIKYNGNDFPNTNTLVSIPAAKNPGTPGFDIMTAVFTNVAQNDNDYIELYWNGTSTDLRLYATSSNGQPATPSIIANVISVGGGGGGSSVVPSLQTVTDVGASTTNQVLLNGGAIAQTLEVTGSLVGNYQVQSATALHVIDCAQSNFFDITLPDSGVCQIAASNVRPGQTVNIIVNTGNNPTGSVAFTTDFKQPSGSQYIPTQATGSIDGLSCIGGLANSTPVLYVVSVTNFVTTPGVPVSASGGQEVTIDNFRYHIFTGSLDTFTMLQEGPVQVLVVGPGGDGSPSGSGYAGGGGGGGVIFETSYVLPTGSFSMAVPSRFSSSIAFSGSAYQLEAFRGGNGATNQTPAQSGGSGGGGSRAFPSGAAGTSGQGFSGSAWASSGGAGGGAAAAGLNRTGDSSVGGLGVYISQFAPLNTVFGSGSAKWFGGYPDGYYGGGGGAQDNLALAIGEGDLGGGARNYGTGSGFYGSGTERNTDGIDFVGGGGMAGPIPGSSTGTWRGGSGAIYVRYPLS